MFDIHIHMTDKTSLKEIIQKLDSIITILEEPDEDGDDIEGLDEVIANLESIEKKVKTIV